ncbi:hypothetical protein LCGC14_1465190 [marine sediment metagenome]|uniref:DNA methylase N-4/N-6 domain-containing protein n=1 Tax=marine sediment metagenome TaxID=412755 RepID=A0A0F9MFU3_9ZZZZ
MDIILTAKVGTNADLFPGILNIFVPKGSVVADVTYGKGVFWRNVEDGRYTLRATDIVTDNIDARKLPYDAGSLDAVVLDPPYMHASGSIKESIAGCYRNNTSTAFKNQAEVRQFYLDAAREAWRVLRPDGILIIKCKDMVEAGKQVWNHVALMSIEGFRCEDLFVLVQQTRPIIDPKWTRQYHARKNHSFFVVLRKRRLT